MYHAPVIRHLLQSRAIHFGVRGRATTVAADLRARDFFFEFVVVQDSETRRRIIRRKKLRWDETRVRGTRRMPWVGARYRTLGSGDGAELADNLQRAT